ncbi:hypothetical protein V8D89_002346 [Ganoderma adspersum]
MSDTLNPSETGTKSQSSQAPGAGTQPETFDQGETGSGYDELQRSQGGDMGGGRAAADSGVAGGYEGHGQQSQAAMGGQAPQQQAGEKKDWLDKGMASMGKKVGVNVSDKNADTAGDFVNKQFTAKTGRGIPGVQ